MKYNKKDKTLTIDLALKGYNEFKYSLLSDDDHKFLKDDWTIDPKSITIVFFLEFKHFKLSEGVYFFLNTKEGNIDSYLSLKITGSNLDLLIHKKQIATIDRDNINYFIEHANANVPSL